MNTTEIKQALQPIHDGIQGIVQDYQGVAEWRKEKDHRDELNQKALDDLIKKAHSVPLNDYGDYHSFSGQLKAGLSENFNSLQRVTKGRPLTFEIKGDMTIANSLTGSVMRSYTEPASLPTQIFNFRDLVRQISTSTGLITMPRESTPTGSASKVPENTAKPQIEAKLSMIDWKADYIAAYVRISKQMLQDLTFLQSWLPAMLIREFYKSENAQFYADLTAVAAGNSTTSATVYAEKIIDWLANLGGANFVPNGIITTFPNWGSLLKTTSGAGNAYSVPGGFTVSPDGSIRIAGIGVRPANWMTTGKTLVGDFSQAFIASCDPVKVEFFDQDQDNVIKNMITVRVEAREVLVIERPEAFIHA